MTTRSKRFRGSVSILVATTLAMTGLWVGGSPIGASAPSSEQSVPTAGRSIVKPTGSVNLSSLPTHAQAPRPQPGEVWNLPQDPEAYALEQVALAEQKQPVTGPVRKVVPNLRPGTVTKNFKAIDQQEGGCLPPDSDGAVGTSQYLEIVNCRVVVFRKSDNVKIKSTNLATFFNDADFIFDPRALYDNTWNRFVLVSTRAADSSTDANRYYRIAVSKTSSASGAYWLFRVNFGFNPGDWCDFPGLGMNQDAIFVTCNMFHRNADGSNSFVSTYAVGFAKARLYNGQGFGVPNFIPGGSTVQPPLLAGQPMQQSDKAFFASANSAADVVTLWRMERAATPGDTTFVFQANVPVPAWDPPPPAFNGGDSLIDTGDGRIEQNTVQNGTSLWAVHTERRVSSGTTLAVPRYYQINVTNNTLVRHGVMFPESASDAWRPSVAVNPSDEAFFTYMSATSTRFPDIRVEGCQVAAGDCDGNLGVGVQIVLSTSSLRNFEGPPLNRNRSGDYSSVDLDPSSAAGCAIGKRAFGTHEYVDAVDHLWDTRIYRFGFC